MADRWLSWFQAARIWSCTVGRVGAVEGCFVRDGGVQSINNGFGGDDDDFNLLHFPSSLFLFFFYKQTTIKIPCTYYIDGFDFIDGGLWIGGYTVVWSYVAVLELAVCFGLSLWWFRG